MKDLFPTKLALGSQFCNRFTERALLNENIGRGRHTVLVAPRRYGKSSLVFKVVHELNMALASIDLFLAHDDSAVIKRLLTGISQAVSHLLPVEQKLLQTLQGFFVNFRVSLTAAGFSIDAQGAMSGFDPVEQIFNGLQGLAKLAEQQGKKVIIFIDEFQDIREANSSKSIQGAIRHVAQQTSHIVFIFSGSNRHLLLELFDDSSKPLYMLCDMMHLERMTSKDYSPHLQKLAKKNWQHPLPKNVFNKIMALTELHPYYVNLLCHEIWRLKNLPDLNDVTSCWERCYDTHEDRLVADLAKLTVKQQSVLKTLALHPATEPTGHGFVSTANVSVSTINQAINVLRHKDMIHKIKKLDDAVPQLALKQLRVLDPLLAYALRKYA